MNDNPLQQRRVNRDRITIHTEADFVGMRRAGKLCAETLDFITPHVQPGVMTEELDRLAHEFMTARGSVPAPLNYRGFPKSICTSINHVVCHGIPGPKRLRDGDIVNIDVTVILNGWHGDSSRMYVAGKPSVKAQRLMDVTYESLMRGIAVVKPGATFGDIGAVIQEYAEAEHFTIVRDFCGHGLGQTFHMPPSVLHYGVRGEGPVLEAGMFFTIEPMLNAGRPDTKILADGWTAVTRDRSLSAQYEHSLAVTQDGYEIFTLSPAGYTKSPYS